VIMLLAVIPPKVEFFPINEPRYVNVFIEAPIGTDIKKTNEITLVLEKQVNDIVNVDPVHGGRGGEAPDGTVTKERRNWLINSVISQVGNGTSDPAQGVSMANTPNKGRIQLSFVKYADRRGLKTNDVLLKLQKELAGYPGVIVAVDKDAAGSAHRQAHQHRDQRRRDRAAARRGQPAEGPSWKARTCRAWRRCASTSTRPSRKCRS
jgi:multidrug efflux pump subunit AcrB